MLSSVRDYSQHGEQQLIWGYFADHRSGFSHYCVDAGAYDGVIGSNTRAMLKSGWAGLLIEPNPRTFERLRALYEDRPDPADELELLLLLPLFG